MKGGAFLLRSGKTGLALTLILALAACSGARERNREIALEELEAEPIYQQAEANLEAGNPDRAA